MKFGTKTKTTPSGLPAAGWWRRVVSVLIDQTLTLIVFWFAGLVAATIIGRVIWTAISQTVVDVREKLGDVAAGIAAANQGNVQQQIQDLISAWRASGKTTNDLGDLLITTYVNNLNLSLSQFLILLLCLLGSIGFVVYNQIIRIHLHGRTLGDSLVGIYCVAESASFPSYRTAIVRYLVMGAIVGAISSVGSLFPDLSNAANSIAAVVLAVDLLIPLFDPHGRTLHDRIAGTYPAHPDRFGYALEHQSALASTE